MIFVEKYRIIRLAKKLFQLNSNYACVNVVSDMR